MMCSNSYLNHYIKVGQLPKCVISSIEMAGQPLVKRAVSSAKICSLATIIRFQFHLDPYDKNTLFLFCGRRSDRIKALLWEGDGFLLMYKRLDNGAFRWPRSADEAMSITGDQYRMLMQGLEIVARHPIAELKETPSIM